MRVKRRILRMVFWVVLLFIQFAVPPQSPAASKKYLSLGTGNPGGTFYFIGAGFAKAPALWNNPATKSPVTTQIITQIIIQRSGTPQ